MGAKKKLIFAIVAVVVAVVLVTVEALAWFAMNNVDDTDDFNISVVGPDGQTVGVSIVGGSYATDEGVATVYPTDYVVAQVDISNPEDTMQRFELKLATVGIIYTLGTEAHPYRVKDIETGDYYYTGSGQRFDETAAVDTTEQFKSFIAPYSNALKYEVYCENMSNFHTAYSEKYLTQASAATATDLAATDYVIAAQNVSLAVSDYTTGTLPVTVHADGTFDLAAGTTATFYILLYFDETAYPTATIGGQQVEIRNSNAFKAQKLRLQFGFDAVV